MKNKIMTFTLLTVAIILPFLISSEYYMHILVLALMYIMLTQGLNLLVGYVGQLSLGHHTFMALGAYASALISLNFGVPVLLSMIIGALVAAFFGYLLSKLTFRVRGSYFVILTTAFSEITRLVINNSTNITGGPMGIRNIPSLSIFGYIFKSKISYYYFGLVLAIITIYVCHRIVDSKTGRAFAALREEENLANSVGISYSRYAMVAVVVGAFFAGVAGGYYAHYTNFISPDLISFNNTVTILLMVVIGGKGTIFGPILGSVIFSFVPELLRAVDNYRLPIYGIILILAVLFMPNGIAPILSNFNKGNYEKRNKEMNKREERVS